MYYLVFSSKKLLTGFFLLFLVFFAGLNSFAQLQNKSNILSSQNEAPVLNWKLSKLDSIKLSSIPKLEISEAYKNMKTTLPYTVDNSQEIYFRPLFNDVAYECGQASGVGVLFTYEMNFTRNVAGNVPENQYPTHFVYNFHNNGQTYEGASYFDSWEIIQQLGTPTVAEYGGLHIGSSSITNKIWVSGYDLYYNAMKNRILDMYAINVDTEAGLEDLKDWLYDHANGSSAGGVANFYSTYLGTGSMNHLPTGTEEAGKWVITNWYSSNHGMVIVGYNDSIKYDYNNDGLYTNDIDQNGDGIVDMKDWEIGGVIIANTYANYGGNSWANQGFAYVMYRTLALPYGDGGIWDNVAHVITCKETCEPQLTMKVEIKHDSRNKLKISAGVSSDTTASEPEHIIDFTFFNYFGGNYYMLGGSTEADKTMEFGLDITPLLNYIGSGENAKFFLLVDENDPSNVGTGQINNFSVIDYTNGINETVCANSYYPLIENDLTSLSVITSVNYDEIEIADTAIPTANINDPYTYQLTATGGTSPYRWDLNYQFAETDSTQTFPMISSQQISTSSNDDGWAMKVLDFEFPYYGEKFDTIFVHNDGFIMFRDESVEWIYDKNLELMFKFHKCIAPYFCDLKYSSGNGIWYDGDINSATFRWNAYVNGQSGSEVNFAAKLYPSGDIEFYYGDILLTSNKTWYAGLSKGDKRIYQMIDVSNTFSPSPNHMVKLISPKFPMELTLSSDGIYSGTVLQEYMPTEIMFKATDNNGIITTKSLNFSTSGINNLLVIDNSVISGNDNLIEFGETTQLSVVIENLETVEYTNSEMYISTDDPYITITDSFENIGTFAPLAIINLNNAFVFEVADNIPNNYEIVFHTQIITSQDTFESQLSFIAYAPSVSTTEVMIMDNGNGIIDPGETSDINIIVHNSGGGKLISATMLLSSFDPYITINDDTDNLIELTGWSSDTISFNITADATTPLAHIINFNLFISGNNQYSTNDEFALMIGMVTENYETADFSQFDWDFGGSSFWFISSDTVYDGNYSVRSGYISNNQDTYLSIQINVLTGGQISFYKKVSCEWDVNTNYDYLSFSIDGNEKGRWDGESYWSFESFAISAGTHTLKWNYHKDGNVSNGDDCAWVDYITFPTIDYVYGALALNTNATDTSICVGDETQLLSFVDGGTGNYTYSWTPTYGLNDPSIANPIANPGVSTNYSLLVDDGVNSLVSSISISVNPIPETPVITQSGDTLFSNALSGNQWYNEFGEIAGANDNYYLTEETGSYYVISNPDGCASSPSDIYFLIHSGLNLIVNNNIVSVLPNPFRDETNICFNLTKSEKVSLEIFDFEGRLVKTILKNQILEKAEYSFSWNSKDNSNNKTKSSVYFYRLSLNEKIYSGKLVLLK